MPEDTEPLHKITIIPRGRALGLPGGYRNAINTKKPNGNACFY